MQLQTSSSIEKFQVDMPQIHVYSFSPPPLHEKERNIIHLISLKFCINIRYHKIHRTFYYCFHHSTCLSQLCVVVFVLFCFFTNAYRPPKVTKVKYVELYRKGIQSCGKSTQNEFIQLGIYTLIENFLYHHSREKQTLYMV